MKIISLFAILICLYSCSDCQTCTRTWKYERYDYSPTPGGGTTHEARNDYTETQIFYACSGSEVEAAEKSTSTKEVRATYELRGTATCTCK